MTPGRGDTTNQDPIGDGAVVVITNLVLLDAMVAAARAHIDLGGTVKIVLEPIKAEPVKGESP
jgi:hypothetical protein